jgi:hypothetical protein
VIDRGDQLLDLPGPEQRLRIDGRRTILLRDRLGWRLHHLVDGLRDFLRDARRKRFGRALGGFLGTPAGANEGDQDEEPHRREEYQR